MYKVVTHKALNKTSKIDSQAGDFYIQDGKKKGIFS